MSTRLGQLVGNDAARRGLLHALARGRLPHALLFYGPEGIGKQATAEALAAALLCPDADPDACAGCNVCRRTADGLHPNLRFVEAEGQFIRIATVREIARESHLRPYEGRAKVYIFPTAERFNDESGNALLKTLEEPPALTHLILITRSRQAVLPTLRSRCQAIEFRPLSRTEVATILEHQDGLPATEADLLARRADGSACRARTLDVAALAEARALALETLRPLAQGKLGGDDAERVVRLAETVAKKDLDHFLFAVLRPLARDALVAASGAGDDALINADAPQLIRDLACDLGVDGAANLLEDIDQAERDLVINANKKLLVEALLLGVFERATMSSTRESLGSR